MKNKFKIGDIVQWEHSDTAQPFIGLITNLNKNEVTIHWFNNVSVSTYDVTLLNHFKRLT
jgi:uncharacterized protein YijF (DUF1287 family)